MPSLKWKKKLKQKPKCILKKPKYKIKDKSQSVITANLVDIRERKTPRADVEDRNGTETTVAYCSCIVFEVSFWYCLRMVIYFTYYLLDNGLRNIKAVY